MNTDAITALELLKSQLTLDIKEIQETYTQFIPTLYVGVTIGYETVIKKIDATLEELREKK